MVYWAGMRSQGEPNFEIDAGSSYALGAAIFSNSCKGKAFIIMHPISTMHKNDEITIDSIPLLKSFQRTILFQT